MTDMPVTLQPEMLDWILKKAQSASADSAAVALLAKWQSGEQEPTFHQVQDVSRKTQHKTMLYSRPGILPATRWAAAFLNPGDHDSGGLWLASCAVRPAPRVR